MVSPAVIAATSTQIRSGCVRTSASPSALALVNAAVSRPWPCSTSSMKWRCAESRSTTKQVGGLPAAFGVDGADVPSARGGRSVELGLVILDPKVALDRTQLRSKPLGVLTHGARANGGREIRLRTGER